VWIQNHYDINYTFHFNIIMNTSNDSEFDSYKLSMK